MIRTAKTLLELVNSTLPDEFFSDLLVVELAGVLAGPAAGSFFAELGAEVIKVENKKTGGDVTRNWQLPGETTEGPSAYYASANYGKSVRMLDLTDSKDLEELRALIEKADIVLTNHRPHTARKFGLEYADLKRLNPEVIAIQLNGYDDPERPAYDVVLQAETGWISMTGSDADHPAKLPVALIDILAGHQIREAALLALIKRLKTGEGSYVEVTLERASLAALANQATNYLMSGHTAKPIGTLHPNIAPYGEWFATADEKRIVLAVGSEKQFSGLCEVVGKPEWAEDESFRTNFARLENRDTLQSLLHDAIQNFGANDLSEKLNARGVPHGFILPLDEVLESTVAQSMVRTQTIDGRLTKRLSGLAFSPSFLTPPSSDGESA